MSPFKLTPQNYLPESVRAPPALSGVGLRLLDRVEKRVMSEGVLTRLVRAQVIKGSAT